MGAALALISALVYGTADFCGGKVTRRSHVATVTFGSQVAGLLVMLIAVAAVPGNGPTPRVVMWGAMGGLAGALGLPLLYSALSGGKMSVVSPVSAVTAAMIPVVVGVAFLGERPTSTAIAGMACAVAAIVLVTAGPNRGNRSEHLGSVFTAMGAGTGFGLFFVCLQRAGSPRDVGLWAAFAARCVSIVVSATVARMRGAALFPDRPSRPLIALAGVLDQSANLLYVLSVGRGLLSVLAVLASLYPVSTVVLARVVDHETLGGPQVAGLTFAFAALVFIAA